MLCTRLLPFLALLVAAQDLTSNSCEQSLCPQVKCRSDNIESLCKCIVNREERCKKRCPDYTPEYQSCAPPKPSPIKPKPVPTPSTTPTTKPVTCDCPQIFCIASWPAGCYCQNGAAQSCYENCGGAPPVAKDCTKDTIISRAPVLEADPKAKASCQCEETMCIQSWPESCYCANAAAQACQKKCGGPKAVVQQCPPQASKTMKTKTKTATPTSTPTLPANPHKVCGGGRANNQQCDEGYVCITDPYTPGCGPACDGLGICVKDKMCGGFPGFHCDDSSQVCHDDPRDECDPKRGGADCGGLCVSPHRSLYQDVQ